MTNSSPHKQIPCKTAHVRMHTAPEPSLYHNNGIRQRYPRHITPAFHFPENEGSSDYLPAGTGMSLPACRTDLLPRITAGRRLRQRPDLLDTFQGSRLPGLPMAVLPDFHCGVPLQH